MQLRALPAIWVPFGLVGLAAGWLTVGFLSHPFVHWLPEAPQEIASLLAGIGGAAAGVAVTEGARDRRGRRHFSPGACMTFAVVGAGVATGCFIGFTIWPTLRAFLEGGLAGAACAVAFLPICAVVLAAAQRSLRARHGTLVAATDRRAIWRTLAGSIALVSLLGAPDWPAAADGTRRTPEPATMIALAAFVVVAFVLVADARAVRRIRGLAGRAAEMEDWSLGDAANEGEAIARVDLGLGHDVRAAIARGSAYRSADRATALLVGNVDEALAAAKGARGASATMLVFAIAILGAHAYAMSARAELSFAERGCADGLSKSCLHAADVLEAEGDLRGALAFHAGACDKTRDPICPRAAALRAALGITTPEEKYEASCYGGDDASCHALARLLDSRHGPTPERAERVRRLLGAACLRQDARACSELDRMPAYP